MYLRPWLVAMALASSAVHAQNRSALSSHRCSSAPIGVFRSDYVLEVTSTLPNYDGLPAELDVHRVSPVNLDTHDDCAGDPIRALILIHGSSIDAVSGFDLQFGEYSLMESLARTGVEAFSVNLLG